MKDIIVALTNCMRATYHEPQYVLANMTRWFARGGDVSTKWEVSPLWQGPGDVLLTTKLLARDHSRWLDWTVRQALELIPVEHHKAIDIGSWWPTGDVVSLASPVATATMQQCPVAQQEWKYYEGNDPYRLRSYLGHWRGAEIHEAATLDYKKEVWFIQPTAMSYAGAETVSAAYLGVNDSADVFAWLSKEQVGLDRAKIRRIALT